jgi:hypothetical protein
MLSTATTFTVALEGSFSVERVIASNSWIAPFTLISTSFPDFASGIVK